MEHLLDLIRNEGAWVKKGQCVIALYLRHSFSLLSVAWKRTILDFLIAGFGLLLRLAELLWGWGNTRFAAVALLGAHLRNSFPKTLD
eukprot:1139511-Pelagomonas_calceolata.AAC.7